LNVRVNDPPFADVMRDSVLLNNILGDFTPPVDTMTTLVETAAFAGNANLEAVVMPGRLATNRPATTKKNPDAER